MRLIDADVLIKELNKRQAEPAYQHHGEDWYVGMISAEELVYEQPIVEPIQWIPCSEKLPEEGKTILMCDIDGDIYVGHKTREHWWSVDDKVKNVVAWMPLPEPYKEDDAK